MRLLLPAAVVLLALVTAAVALVRRRIVVVGISGLSMAPTLGHGDLVLVRRRRGRVPRRGQVILIEVPEPCRPGERPERPAHTWVVKRVVALPGDPAPRFLPGWACDPAGRVPAGHVVLLGDNPEVSRDSRHFGPVPLDRVLGVAVRRLNSWRPALADTGNRTAAH
ncbi:S26 family signal peptidase [Micromonospora sp. NPDC023956]|uniref:S26 family signal peptidase n=1 Tax=Micromonospora sp. NPDC023956 TaxID=3155722 RepID=UPI003403B028